MTINKRFSAAKAVRIFPVGLVLGMFAFGAIALTGCGPKTAPDGAGAETPAAGGAGGTGANGQANSTSKQQEIIKEAATEKNQDGK